MSTRLAAWLFLIVSLNSMLFAKTKYQPPGPIHLDHDGKKWAEKTLRKLSLEEKVGQLFMIWARAQFLNVNSPDYAQPRDTMLKYRIGSFAMTVPYQPPFLYRSQPYEAAVMLNRLQSDSKLPLLIAADFERGIPMRIDGGTVFPHAMAFGATGKVAYAEAYGRITAQESRAVGVHWNFFPVADVNSNPANPIINTRSFGENPQQVGEMVAAYIRGAHENGMLTTAKHFPGHGDTSTDSHLGVAQVNGNMQSLKATELPPFKSAIAAGVDSVMVAHVTVPALDPDPNHVATTSPVIVTGLLKTQLGYTGLIITDALDMGALTRLYRNDIGRAAVDAFKAGNDVLLIPADLNASIESMLQAVKSGEISESRLDQSVLKILEAKASLGLQKSRLVDLDKLSRLVGMPENVALGQKVADDAITLVRDNKTLLPLKKTGTVMPGLPYQHPEEAGSKVLLVIFTEDLRSASGHTLEREIRRRVPGTTVIYLDPRIANAMSDDILKLVDRAESIVAAVYMVPIAGKIMGAANGDMKNSVSLENSSGLLLRNILDRAPQKTLVIAAGNPYLAQDFPSIQNYMCTFSDETVSDISAAKAVFGEIAIHGHLPVTIPGFATRGAGIDRNIQTSTSGDPNAFSK